MFLRKSCLERSFFFTKNYVQVLRRYNYYDAPILVVFLCVNPAQWISNSLLNLKIAIIVNEQFNKMHNNNYSSGIYQKNKINTTKCISITFTRERYVENDPFNFINIGGSSNVHKMTQINRNK